MSPIAAARRIVLGAAFVMVTVLAGGLPATPASAQVCDPAYPDFCIAPIWEVDYLDCATVGVTNFTALDPDLRGFDPDLNGLGCEPYYGEIVTDVASNLAESAEAMPIQAAGCDPSYPEICLASSPDVNCPEVGFALTVIHDESLGAYDPHNLDEDLDGIGCESYG